MMHDRPAPTRTSSSLPTSAGGAAGGGIRRRSRRGAPQAGIPLRERLRRRLAERLFGEEGAATAEYAIATLAAVGLAGLLVVILKGDEVRQLLSDLIRGALSVGG